MKNKGVTYLLLGAVCLIWGIVIYRIISCMGDEETGMPETSSSKYVDLDSVTEKYALIASYRDPFLGKSVIVPYANQQRKASMVKPIVIPKPITPPKPVVYIDWSFIQYHGLISNKGTAKLIGLLKIKEEDHIVSANTAIGDVKITFLSKDSVGVIYQEQKKMIGR